MSNLIDKCTCMRLMCKLVLSWCPSSYFQPIWRVKISDIQSTRNFIVFVNGNRIHIALVLHIFYTWYLMPVMKSSMCITNAFCFVLVQYFSGTSISVNEPVNLPLFCWSRFWRIKRFRLYWGTNSHSHSTVKFWVNTIACVTYTAISRICPF